VEITDPDIAQKFGFLGSPSIRIDGIDVEPGAPEIKTFGFGCRTYSDEEGRRSGLPAVDLIQQAARERRSARAIAYTDAAFSTNAQALKMCPQLKKWVWRPA
jgi:hypothetical protein